jgi:glycosyltransferase involved in cell wall biosynthesis
MNSLVENNPALTIAIPTFNRARRLEELIDLLYSEIKFFKIPLKKIEILVSDNGSIDNTQEVLLGYKKKYINFKPLFSFENKGFDANYLKCLRESSGEYLWIIGDDDRICVGALKKIYDFIAIEKLDLIIVNGGSINSLGQVQNRIQTIDDTSLFSLKDGFADFAWHMTWISVSIFRRQALNIPPKDALDKVYRDFAHMGVIIHSHLICSRIKFLSDSFVYSEGDKDDWSADPGRIFELIGERFVIITQSLSHQIDRRSLQDFTRAHSKYLNSFSMGFFLNLTTKGFFLNKNKYYIFKIIYRVSEFWFPSFLIVIMGSKFCQKLKLIWNFCKKVSY